jgi:pyridinium-3,5-biscarboxylic acid mononucleotide sulfurtransferase
MIDDALIQIGRASGQPEAGSVWQERVDRLRREIASLNSVVIAYSGGVDSSLLLRVSHDVLGDRAHGVIGKSDSYASSELEAALAQAAGFGARVEIVTTGELSNPAFRSNPVNRCYHCKSELYRRLDEVAQRLGAEAILDGTIVDDLGDWRPGRKAADERRVRSPLADLGFTKADVREAARHFGIASHDKPASPCLASRIPYGTEITARNLSEVERAEQLIHSLGFRELRVRHHGGIARIEVPLEELPRFAEPELRDRVVAGLKAIGFKIVVLDLEGFRSGSLNRVAGIATPNTGPAEGGQEIV